MKKLQRFLLLILLVLLLGSSTLASLSRYAYAQTYFEIPLGSYSVGKSQLKLYQKPDLLYGNPEMIPVDNEFVVIEVSPGHDWATVSYRGKTRYMFWESFQYCSYLSPETRTYTLHPNVDKVNLRERPTMESRILEQLRIHETVDLLCSRPVTGEDEELWYSVYYETENVSGYILKSLLDDKEVYPNE